MMSEGVFYDTLRQAILAAISMALPILAAALVIGLIVGLFQALTSIQEMTLTFVPKLVLVVLAFGLLANFMMVQLSDYFSFIFDLQFKVVFSI